MISAEQALVLLRDGNERFASSVKSQRDADTSLERRVAIADVQEPFAIILGCSDSRVPAEIVFDRGLGDLFVIRVAGNIVAPSQIGSVEFAAQQFKTSLVVVMGHTQCGAIGATIEQLLRPTEQRSRNLRSIVDRIRPAVEPLLEMLEQNDSVPADHATRTEQLFAQAIRANVLVAANQLRHGSEILEKLIEAGELKVVGAEYSLETGVVDFFDID
ncbi:MAG: carbonic anhydrase [Gammaproteobacteria bacterium]